MTKQKLLLLCAILAFLPQISPADDFHPFRLAVIGDRTGGHTPGIYGKVIAELNLLRPDLAVTVGDHIEGYTNDKKELNEQWDELLGLFEKALFPYYLTPGNHDVLFDEMEEVWKERIGPVNNSFDYAGCHFVLFNNAQWDLSEELPKESIQWLKDDLQQNRNARYTFVFFHKPFWFETLGAGQHEPLHEIFVENGVDCVFSGHYHYFSSAVYDGIQYVMVGSSGGHQWDDDFWLGLFYHYLLVTVTEEGPTFAMIRQGSVLPIDEFKVEEARLGVTLDEGRVTVEPIAYDSQRYDYNTTITVKYEKGMPVEPEPIFEEGDNWTFKLINREKVADDTVKYHYEASLKGLFFPLPDFQVPYRIGKDKDITSRIQTPGTRQALCTPLKARIDGRLGEWNKAKPETLFYAPAGLKVKSDPVKFYFGYDKKNLYVAAACLDLEMDKLKTSAKKRDDAVYLDDCVGFFFQPDPDENLVYQCYFSAKGTIFDQSIRVKCNVNFQTDMDWDGQYNLATRKDNNAWYFEAAIPFETLGLDEVSAGDVWRVNFRRKQSRLQTTSDWITPISYDPTYFGTLVFE